MASSSSSSSSCSSMLLRFAAAAAVAILLIAVAATADKNASTYRPEAELRRYRRAHALLRRVNKPSVKVIESPDGDIIDCVPAHRQPAFDHPALKGQTPLVAAARPVIASSDVLHGNINVTANSGVEQLWAAAGEACPEGTVPIRRTTMADVLRASSARRFGRRAPVPPAVVRRDVGGSVHEHAVGYVAGDRYYGAKASINVWAPKVGRPSEFSLSQMWIIAGTFGGDLNTIEAGWQVSPQLYGDNSPRFFIYWTTDAYESTGCYNLLCSGFVQTNNRIAMGAAISPASAYNGGQFDISLLIWKDPNHGNWWLQFGGSGELVGYWPSVLFTHLASHATMVQFGGEVVNTRPGGIHTSTEMGSGHFAQEGFGRASYFRNLEVVDADNCLIPLPNLRVVADHPGCYNVQGGVNAVWGNYFYYGGPGRSSRCP